MKYFYEEDNGCAEIVRWFRWTKSDDVRTHRPAKGWSANAMLLDYHPIKLTSLKESQWWICEKKFT
jgi:hypothetical protein